MRIEQDGAETESSTESVRLACTMGRISELLNRINFATFASGPRSLGSNVLWFFSAPAIIDMREKTFQIALFAALGSMASVALALPVKPSHKPAPHQKHEAQSFYVHGSGEHSHAVERRASEPKLRERKAKGHKTIEHKSAERSVSERRRPEVEKPVAARVQVATHAIEEAAPAGGDDTLGVRHNRKIHLTEENAAQGETTSSTAEVSSGQRRQASRADFLPTPAAVASAQASAAPIVRQAPMKTVAVVRPERKIVDKVVPAADVVVTVQPPVVMPALYTKSGRLIVPPALKGSHEILLHQNEMADAEGLNRIQDDVDLERLREAKLLVPIPASSALMVDERLPSNRRYCRPWTAQFLAAMARAHYARFHTPLQVNSAVRTVEFQERLRYTNGNAAPAEGETASPHLTGQAVDLAKHGLSMTEIAWMRGYLLPLVQQGKVDVEEEFQQACFHVSVYRKYLPQAAPKRVIPAHRAGATALAAAIR
jgi:hypothetical protein